MPLHLVQLLCPSRHAILALAYEVKPPADGMDDATALAHLKAQWDHLQKTEGVNPWCGICGSRKLRWETANTRWDTLEQAAPFLKDEQAKNLDARLQIGQDRWLTELTAALP